MYTVKCKKEKKRNIERGTNTVKCKKEKKKYKIGMYTVNCKKEKKEIEKRNARKRNVYYIA